MEGTSVFSNTGAMTTSLDGMVKLNVVPFSVTETFPKAYLTEQRTNSQPASGVTVKETFASGETSIEGESPLGSISVTPIHFTEPLEKISLVTENVIPSFGWYNRTAIPVKFGPYCPAQNNASLPVI